MKLTIEAQGMDELIRQLRATGENATKDFGVVAWETGKYGVAQIAKEVNKELNLSQTEIKKVIHAKKLRPVGALITVPKEARYPLKRFKPKSMKKGVKAKVSRRLPGRYYPGAFMGPRPGVIASRLGGHVFEREGKSRLPIFKVMGASPWGVLVKNEFILPTLQFKLGKRLEENLKKRIQRRLGGYIKG